MRGWVKENRKKEEVRTCCIKKNPETYGMVTFMQNYKYACGYVDIIEIKMSKCNELSEFLFNFYIL